MSKRLATVMMLACLVVQTTASRAEKFEVDASWSGSSVAAFCAAAAAIGVGAAHLIRRSLPSRAVLLCDRSGIHFCRTGKFVAWNDIAAISDTSSQENRSDQGLHFYDVHGELVGEVKQEDVELKLVQLTSILEQMKNNPDARTEYVQQLYQGVQGSDGAVTVFEKRAQGFDTRSGLFVGVSAAGIAAAMVAGQRSYSVESSDDGLSVSESEIIPWSRVTDVNVYQDDTKSSRSLEVIVDDGESIMLHDTNSSASFSRFVKDVRNQKIRSTHDMSRLYKVSDSGLHFKAKCLDEKTGKIQTRRVRVRWENLDIEVGRHQLVERKKVLAKSVSVKSSTNNTKYHFLTDDLRTCANEVTNGELTRSTIAALVKMLGHQHTIKAFEKNGIHFSNGQKVTWLELDSEYPTFTFGSKRVVKLSVWCKEYKRDGKHKKRKKCKKCRQYYVDRQQFKQKFLNHVDENDFKSFDDLASLHTRALSLLRR